METREQFEQWYRDTVLIGHSEIFKDSSMRRNHLGYYVINNVKEAYDAWQAASATQAKVEPVAPEDECYLIFFDDRDREPIIFYGRDIAKGAMDRAGVGGWNAHLFRKVFTNFRDARKPGEPETLDAALFTSPTPSQDAVDAEKDAVRQLIARHAALLEDNPYAYFELAYTRQTEWMAWLCTKPQADDPARKVIAQGQGSTPEEACDAAIASTK